MSGEGDAGGARPAQPFGSDEDSYADIWDQVEGSADEADDDNPEAFTEFAVSPGSYARGASLRRRAQPETPLFDVDGPAEEELAEPTHDAAAPGQKETADDVRSLLDKVMEEALPTNPNVAAPAFPEDGTPTLRPDDPPPARARVGRDTSTQLVDAEAAAMEYAVGGGARPDSFDAVPAALSDEVKAAPKVVRGQPAEDLRHLTNDLDLDVAATSVEPPPPTVAPPPRLASDPLPDFMPGTSEREDPIAEPPLELAFDPRKPPSVAPPDPERLLDEVTPKGSPNLMIGLAVAMIGLLLVLVVKSLL